MLNYKGKYYAKKVLKELGIIRDRLCELKILKTSDLGEQTNLTAISAGISTDFASNNIASVLVKGYSEIIRENFYVMGEENLANLPEASKYYEDLNKVYDSDSSNKGFEYFKLFVRYNYVINNCLRTALLKADRFEGVPSKRKGASFSFDTNLSNVIALSNTKEDYTKMGLRLPDSEGKFIQIDGSDMYKGKVSNSAAAVNPSSVNVPVIINITYNDEKELSKKLYPIVSTYKNRPIDKVEMISGAEFVTILKEGYNATMSNAIVDMEAFYEQADKIARQKIQDVEYFVTGKNRLFTIPNCQKKGEWPMCVINANSSSDLGNVNLLTPRDLNLLMSKSRKNEKSVSAARKAA